MKEHIHLKICASDKQELATKAKELGLSLSGYIRFRLKENHLNRKVTLSGIMLNNSEQIIPFQNLEFQE